MKVLAASSTDTVRSDSLPQDPPGSFHELAEALGHTSPGTDRPVVCIQGLGYVGAATAVAVASALDETGEPCFNVVGVELPTHDGEAKARALNAGVNGISAADPELERALEKAHQRMNLIATTDERAFGLADVILVAVNMDVIAEEDDVQVDYDRIRTAVRVIGSHAAEGSLVIVETTVPPGTTEKVIAPELGQALGDRGLAADSILLAYSYERVMPGEKYFESIVRYWRCFAGFTPKAADACEQFLSRVIDVDAYPLTRLDSTTACELGKVLENSYRASTIAFIEEWARLAEAVGVDLFQVIDSIRLRPTHSNIRQPGFGVGGYCLTKDPLLGEIGARDLFGLNLEFPFSRRSVEVNNLMPLVSVDRVEALLGGSLEGRKILLFGVSYRANVADTRQSPSEVFARAAKARGARILFHDPIVGEWPEMGLAVSAELPAPIDVDALVFAVPHDMYRELDLRDWLRDARPLVLDANRVLSTEQRTDLRGLGCVVESIGRGTNL